MVDREPAILYAGQGMKITDYPKSPSEHLLFIEDLEYLLPRGALEELGREESQGRFRSMVDQLNPEVMPLSRGAGISSEQMQFAFNQAKINELETQLGEAVRKLADIESEDARSQ